MNRVIIRTLYRQLKIKKPFKVGGRRVVFVLKNA